MGRPDRTGKTRQWRGLIDSKSQGRTTHADMRRLASTHDLAVRALRRDATGPALEGISAANVARTMAAQD